MKKLFITPTTTLRVASKAHAYTGAGEIITGGTTTNDLSRDIYIETLEAFDRSNVFLSLVMKQTIAQGNAGQFIVGGKSDGSDAAEYDRGTQVSVSDTPFDERTIVLSRPQYVAKRIDQYEEKVAHYDVRGPITNFMGETLAYNVDLAIADAMWLCAQGTGAQAPLVGNPGPNDQVVMADMSAMTPAEKGDEIAAAIFSASAALLENDVMGEQYAVLSPRYYGYLVQSGQAVNTDFTSGNGGYDTGVVYKVGGVVVVSSNNVKGTLGATTTADVGAYVFTSEAVGVLELIGLQTNQEDQIDFLDSTLMTAYYAMGTGTLRPEAAVVIMETNA